MAKYVYGIDLGTTYSCIAYVDKTGRANIIRNIEGNNTTPSVVNFSNNNQVIVGEVAKENAIIDPQNTMLLVKTLMGKTNYAISYNGEDKSPEEVSAYILRKLTNDASKMMDTEVKDVVITCPAYFGTAERMATKNAGKIAGLNVLEIISEPTAAAIYYGCTKEVEEKTILIYDLGGGTFDVTIMNISEEKIEVLCSDGNPELGGKDWDDMIMRYVADEFKAKTGYEGEFDEYAQQDLRLKVEKAKKQLSSKEEVMVLIDVAGIRARINLDRTIFDEVTSVLLNETLEKTDSVINVAEQKGYNLDEIMLVGGSTRMPQVTKALIEKYGIKPKVLEPDEAVAKGAAIYAVNVYMDKRNSFNIVSASDDSIFDDTKDYDLIELDNQAAREIKNNDKVVPMPLADKNVASETDTDNEDKNHDTQIYNFKFDSYNEDDDNKLSDDTDKVEDTVSLHDDKTSDTDNNQDDDDFKKIVSLLQQACGVDHEDKKDDNLNAVADDNISQEISTEVAESDVTINDDAVLEEREKAVSDELAKNEEKLANEVVALNEENNIDNTDNVEEKDEVKDAKNELVTVNENERDLYKEELSVDTSLMRIGGKVQEVVVSATKSFAIEVIYKDKDICYNMIIKNTPMPDGKLTVSRTFGVYEDNMQTAEVVVYENDFMEETFEIDKDYILGTVELELSGDLPKGAPIEIIFTLNKEGILEVCAKDLTNDKMVQATMRAEGILTNDKVEELAGKARDMEVL